MGETIIIGLDIAKSIFQLHGADEKAHTTLKRRLKRAQVLPFFAKQPRCVVALEACGSGHYWGREIAALGHTVKLVPAQFAKRFRDSRNKNDARDAAALAVAGERPDLRAVPVKSEEQQAKLTRNKARALLVRQHTQISNALRGLIAEFGLIAPAGDKGLAALVETVLAGTATLPAIARSAIEALIRQWQVLTGEIAQLTAAIWEAAKSDATVKRLMTAPGVGPMVATSFAAKVEDPNRFRSGRNCAAWLGFAPKEDASANNRRLGAISKAGDEDLRSLLVLGARSVLQQAKRNPVKADPWVRNILRRRPYKVAAAALAARTARILWAMLKSGESYKPRRCKAAA
jgi:transposase